MRGSESTYKCFGRKPQTTSSWAQNDKQNPRAVFDRGENLSNASGLSPQPLFYQWIGWIVLVPAPEPPNHGPWHYVGLEKVKSVLDLKAFDLSIQFQARVRNILRAGVFLPVFRLSRPFLEFIPDQLSSKLETRHTKLTELQ